MNGFDNIEPTPLQGMEQALVLATIASNWPSENESALYADAAPQQIGYSSIKPEPHLSFEDCARSFSLDDCEPQFRLEDCLPDFIIEDCAPPASISNFAIEPILGTLARELPAAEASVSRLPVNGALESAISDKRITLDETAVPSIQNSSIEEINPITSAQKVVEFTARRPGSTINDSSDRVQLADRFLDRYTSMLDFIDAELSHLAVEASGAARKGDLTALSKCRHLTKEFSDMQDELAARASNIAAIIGTRNAA